MVECIVDSQLKCCGKRGFTKRGSRFSQITLKRPSGYLVKFTLPATTAAEVEIGGYYKLAILPDSPPAEPVAPPALNPGDHVLHWWKWAGVKVWRPAVLVGFTPRGSAIVRNWRHGVKDLIVKAAAVTLATDPFPAVEDFSAMLPGDTVLWGGRQVTIEGFVSTDQALVNYPVGGEYLPVLRTAAKLVRLTELAPLSGRE